MTIRAGRLRHRVSIQKPNETRDAHGGITKGWQTETTRWGSVEPLSGRDLEIAHKIDGRITHKVVMRYFDEDNVGLTERLGPTYRLLHKTRVLNIVSVQNMDERNREFMIMCEEDV